MDTSQYLFSFTLGLVGVIYILCGLWLWKRPPKKINEWVGYRTPRAMKSQAAWDFAQVHGGKAIFCCGLALTGIALLSLPFAFARGVAATMVTLVILAFTAFPIYLTERKLFKRYGQDH